MKEYFLKILIKVVHLLRPLIRFLAVHSDIKVLYPWHASGQHPLIFEDTSEKYKEQIPKSTHFNTRSGKIVVGKNTVFGEDVMVLTGKHKFISEISELGKLHEVPEGGRDIIIGSNCYIGGGAIIIGPVTIGDFAVICAGAVVTKNVLAKNMVGGVPAKIINELKFKGL